MKGWKRTSTGVVAVAGGLGLVAVLVAAAAGGAGRARTDGPFRPADDGLVLVRRARGVTAAQAPLRRALARDPRDLRAALALAEQLVETARATSDPRYLGRAQAVLAPWWGRADAPPEALLLEATIRQSNHEFALALALLERVISARPDDLQAWLTRATLLQVLARPDEAARACAEVARIGGAGLVAEACSAGVLGATGHAREAYQRLAAAAAQAAVDPAIAAWAASALGELAERVGDVATAERHYRAALAAEPGDAYASAALADLWLGAGRDAEVVSALTGREDVDALLLRLAIAEKRLRSGAAAAHAQLLGARFDAMRARGDRIHQREEARFELEVRGRARVALALAVDNWAVQRELADALVLLEAARACDAPAQAAPVLAWRRAHQVEHPRLARLAAQLEAP